MGANIAWRLTLFSLFLFINSGLSKAQMPPPRHKLTGSEENQILFSSTSTADQLDEVPVVNPTTPGTSNPSPAITPRTPQAPNLTGSPPTIPQAPFLTGPPPTTPQAPYLTGPPPTTPQEPYLTGSPPNIPTQTQTPSTPPTSSSGGTWCIASQTASPTALQVGLDYACGYGGADCSAIQQGGSCYNPDTVRDHASYAFNAYYQKNPGPTSCSFGGTAQLTNTDPSNGSCRYAPSSSSQSMSPTANISPPSPPTPSSSITPTPPSMTVPGGPSIYGSEPTASPNSATPDSRSLQLLFSTICLCGLLLVLNYV